MSCEARACGTTKGYSFYGCRCPEGLADERRYRKRLAAGIQPPAIIDATGTRRRIQGLMALGWPLKDIAAKLGYGSRSRPYRLVTALRIHRRLADAVIDIYGQLSMTPGPSKETRRRALKAGFFPPLAWDDDTIDDPNAQPMLEEPVEVDEVAVQRALSGDRPEGLRRAELIEAIKAGRAMGLSNAQIGQRLGMKTSAVEHIHLRAVS